MKKLLVLALTLALLVATTVPAMAAGGPGGGNNPGIGPGTGAGTGSGLGIGTGNMRGIFALSGTVASVDPLVRTVSVEVLSGNKLAQPSIGQTVTLQTTAATRFLLRNPDGTCTVIAFDDLAAGQNVSVNGSLANDVWTAIRITVGARLVHYR
jgi:hypothetical protein